MDNRDEDTAQRGEIIIPKYRHLPSTINIFVLLEQIEEIIKSQRKTRSKRLERLKNENERLMKLIIVLIQQNLVEQPQKSNGSS